MKINKITAVILSALLIATVCTSCNSTAKQDYTQSDITPVQTVDSAQNDSTSDTQSESSTASNSDIATEKTSANNSDEEANELFTKRDLSGEYDEKSAVKITCSDKSFKVDGNGAKADGNVLTITDEGVYILSGTVKDGRIVVDADDTAKVQIVLNGCSVTSSDYCAIYAKNADKLFITLAKDTENTLSDASTYKEASEESNVDATVFSKCDLTVNGSGKLNVNGNMSHAIVSKDDLKITGGTLKITSAGSAVCGKDSVRIADGNIGITSGGDGIKSDNTEKAEKGYIYIGGGTLTITSDGDAIQAETDLTCENTNITITSGSGSENSLKTHTENFGGRGMMGQNFGTQEAEGEQDAVSAKGLKASGNITVSDSTVNADTADDSVHSNSNVTITSGTLTLKSGDDGIHADSSVVIDGGKITVSKSYEGIEGSNITVNGGEIDVTSSDDGFNAAGGSDGSSMGGRPGQNTFSANSDIYLKITGGTVKVNAGGDGLDSNNTLTIDGGTIYVDGPSDNGNAAVDYETTATINGGTLVAVGSSGMAESFSQDSKQASILYCLQQSHSAGEKIILKSSSGEEIISYTAAKAFNCVNLSSPKLKSGESYTLTVGSESCSIELTSNTYSNGGMGGMGGMNGGMGDMGGMRNKPDGMDGGMNGGFDAGMPNGDFGAMTTPPSNDMGGVL